MTAYSIIEGIYTQQGTNEIKEMFGDGKTFSFPKPSALIHHLLQLATAPDDLILDSFAGSGTTGHAVLALNKADGGKRRFILVEMDENICKNVTAQRLQRVIDGYGEMPGLGGGFRYCTLGEPLFDENGQIRSSVKFADLAAHIFFTETGVPIPKRATGKSPRLGIHEGKAVYLLFNGVLGDRRPNSGNVLTHDVAKSLVADPENASSRVVFGEACRLSAKSLEQYGITFRQIPFQVKVD